MAIYGQSFTITYTAWDTANNTGKTGDVANHTLRWVKDGTAAAPTNSPAEVDATNTPGLYKVELTATEAQAVFATLAGKSSTADVEIMPVPVPFEQFPANFASLGIEADGDLTKVNTCAVNTDMRGTNDAYTGTPPTASAIANAVWSAGTRTLTSISSLLESIWTYAQRTLTAGTRDTEIDAIKTKTDALPASPAAEGSQMALADGAITAAKIAASALDGKGDWNTVAPDNASITAIKNKTDSLPASPAPAQEYDTQMARIDQSLSATESNIRGADSDTLKTVSDQVDGITGGATNNITHNSQVIRRTS